MLAAPSSPVSGFVFAVAVLASAPKISPESVAAQVFDAVEAGQVEVLADERSRDVKAKLSRDHELIYRPSRNSGTPRSAAPADPRQARR
jgi:hypothetical protein